MFENVSRYLVFLLFCFSIHIEALAQEFHLYSGIAQFTGFTKTDTEAWIYPVPGIEMLNTKRYIGLNADFIFVTFNSPDASGTRITPSNQAPNPNRPLFYQTSSARYGLVGETKHGKRISGVYWDSYHTRRRVQDVTTQGYVRHYVGAFGGYVREHLSSDETTHTFMVKAGAGVSTLFITHPGAWTEFTYGRTLFSKDIGLHLTLGGYTAAYDEYDFTAQKEQIKRGFATRIVLGVIRHF